MVPRASKQPKPDDAQNAFRIVREMTGEASKTVPPGEPEPVAESPASAAARALGALGASKGGQARAKALTKAERAAIARKGAVARWGKKRRGKKGT